MFGSIASFVLAHRRASLVAFAAAVLLLMAGNARLRIDFSFESFVGSNDPAFAHLAEVTEVWGTVDGTLIVLVRLADDAPGTLLDPPRLEALERLLVALENTEAVGQAAGIPRLPRDTGAVGMIELKPILDQVRSHPDRASSVQKDLLADQALVPGLVSADGRATTLLAELAINTDDVLIFYPALLEVRAALDKTLAELSAPSGRAELELLTSGIPAVRADLVEAMRTDQMLFGTLTMLIIIVLLLVIFRRLHGLLIAGMAAALPTALLFGLMGWTDEPMGVISQVFVSLIPVIAVADAIHVLARFHTEAFILRKAPDRGRPAEAELDDDERRRAIVATYREVGTACFFTSVTTAIGFLSLTLADMNVLRNFGLYAGAGILLAFVCLLIGGPLALDRVRRLPDLAPAGREPRLEAALAQVARSSLRHRWAVIVVAAVIGGGLAWLGTGVDVDNRLSDALDPDHPTHAAGRFVDEHLGGQFQIVVDIAPPEGGEPTGVLYDPRVLAACADVEAWSRDLEGVRAVQGPALLLATLNEALTGQNLVPDSRELAAQLLLLADLGDAASLLIKPDGARGRIVIRMPDGGGRLMTTTGMAVEERVEQAFAELPARATVSGLSYAASRGFNNMSRELLESLLAAVLFIALVLGFLFRSVRIALVSLVPNLLPLLCCLGALVLLEWTLTPTVSVVFTVALGIAVDDTIHLLARVFEGRRRQHGAERSLVDAVVHTGRPVLLTTVILTAGFAINTLSSFPALRQLGLLGATAFASALVCDVVLLPALLRVVWGREAAPDDGQPAAAKPR